MKHDSFPGAVGAYGFHNYVSIPPSSGAHMLTAMLEGRLVGVYICNNLYRGSHRYPVQRPLGKIYISEKILNSIEIERCSNSMIPPAVCLHRTILIYLESPWYCYVACIKNIGRRTYISVLLNRKCCIMYM